MDTNIKNYQYLIVDSNKAEEKIEKIQLDAETEFRQGILELMHGYKITELQINPVCGHVYIPYATQFFDYRIVKVKLVDDWEMVFIEFDNGRTTSLHSLPFPEIAQVVRAFHFALEAKIEDERILNA